ncbi:MAG: hypothetical protein DYH05_13460, partial [Acidobacteria bacterium ACB1]|nr:hypothetical protein [Acidobacteria bacterium ACB1]
RNYTQCDSMLIGSTCEANTFPYIEVMNNTARVEHEATTSKISEEQLFYLQQRGIAQEDAVSLIINGFCKEVFRELPMEYAVEAQKLLGLKLEEPLDKRFHHGEHREHRGAWNYLSGSSVASVVNRSEA